MLERAWRKDFRVRSHKRYSDRIDPDSVELVASRFPNAKVASDSHPARLRASTEAYPYHLSQKRWNVQYGFHPARLPFAVSLISYERGKSEVLHVNRCAEWRCAECGVVWPTAQAYKQCGVLASTANK